MKQQKPVYATPNNRGRLSFSFSRRGKQSWQVGTWELREYDEQFTWQYRPLPGLSRQPDQEWLYWNCPDNPYSEGCDA